MQQTFLQILKKYFNVIKVLVDFFCLVGYIWPKSIKDDAVLAMIKRSGLRYQIFCVVVFSLSKENAVLYYYYYYYYYYRQRKKKKITLLTGINRFRNDNNTWGTQEQKR